MDEDFLLIYKMKRGHESAMDTFVRKYYTTIFKYCQYRISNRSDVEDITQETFCRFFRALPEYKHYGKAKNFLYKIAGNICKDYYIKQIEFSLIEDLQSEENQMEFIEDKIDVERALNQLSEELKEVVILYYFEGLKLKEIAEILEIGLSLVKYRIRKAKEQLMETLGEEDEDVTRRAIKGI